MQLSCAPYLSSAKKTNQRCGSETIHKLAAEDFAQYQRQAVCADAYHQVAYEVGTMVGMIETAPDAPISRLNDAKETT